MKAILYALCSAQGTACSETVCTAAEYAEPGTRARIERECCRGGIDDPLPDTWADVSDNEAFWEDCGCCGGMHPLGFTGDCRDDANRWPS